MDAMSQTGMSYQIPLSGRMSFELTWSDPSVNLDLYLVSPDCRDLYPLNQCAVIARSTNTSGTREEVSKNVISNETLKFFIDNRSQASQTPAGRFAIE